MILEGIHEEYLLNQAFLLSISLISICLQVLGSPLDMPLLHAV